MQDVPDSTPNNLKVDLEDILDPDERTNDIDEERRTADHESEFYDGDKDQDGDTMPPNQLSSNNTKNDPSSSSINTGKFFSKVKTLFSDFDHIWIFPPKTRRQIIW